MATIPRQWLTNYTTAINAVSKGSQDALSDYLAYLDLTRDVGETRAQVVAFMEGVCGAATSATAQLALSFYNLIREYELGEAIDAVPDGGRIPAATDGAVRAFADKLVKGDPDAFKSLCLGRVDYEVKVAAAQACLNAAKQDPKPPRFARVPTGDETCDFCLMLASRGFVYHTETTASHAHANCDCRVVPSWLSHTVEGYDPQAIADQWVSAVEGKASERAARNGTSVDEERHKIMDSYARASQRARAHR